MSKMGKANRDEFSIYELRKGKGKKYRGKHRSHTKGAGSRHLMTINPGKDGTRHLVLSGRRAQREHELQTHKN